MLKAFLAPISQEMLERARDGDDPRLHAQALLDRYKRFIPEIAAWIERPNCMQEWLAWFPDWNDPREYGQGPTMTVKTWLEQFLAMIDQDTHGAPAQ